MTEVDLALKEKARKMMIDGESFETIVEETHLRLKDLKRIQHDINKNF